VAVVADPEPQPRATVAKIAKRTAPAPQKIRITSTEDDLPSPSAPVPALRAEKPAVHPAPPLAITTMPSVASAMPVPESKTAPAPAEDDPKAPARRRNPVVRVFQHVFGRRPATTPAPADTPAQP